MNRTRMSERELRIKQELDSRRSQMAVGIPESKFVENVGGIVRTANAFLVGEVVMDSAAYNKCATAGASKWETIVVTDDIIKYFRERDYVLVALEQHARSVDIWHFCFPERTALIIGHEVHGMSDQMVDCCDHVILIPQYGAVESLNVATATSIAMYEYARQHNM